MSMHLTAAVMVGIVLVSGGGSIAQPAAPAATALEPGAPGMAAKVAERQTEMMKAALDLTSEQVAKVGPINQAEMTSLKELMARYKNDPSLDRKNLPRDAMAVSKSRDEQLQQVLTPQQWQTWQSAKAERTAETMTRLMTVQLDLSSQQVARVDQINRMTAKAISAEMGNNFQAKPKREKVRITRKLQAIGEERDRSLVKVLSTDQWTAYQRNREEMKEIIQERLESTQ